MKKLLLPVVLINALLTAPGSLVAGGGGAPTALAPAVRTMAITGEIAKGNHGYIIRGKKPAEVFSILNPDPGVLDPLVKSGKTVRIAAKIVSGDNVKIEKIDGRQYPQ